MYTEVSEKQYVLYVCPVSTFALSSSLWTQFRELGRRYFDKKKSCYCYLDCNQAYSGIDCAILIEFLVSTFILQRL